jgi:hypothetical protein
MTDRYPEQPGNNDPNTEYLSRTGRRLMARIVGAFGVSHGPLLSTPPEQWHQRAAFDRKNPRHAYRGAYYDFDSLVALRGPEFGKRIDIEHKTAAYTACQRAIAEVAQRYAACGANAAIILGNDQHEMLTDELTPAFMVYAGSQIENIHPDAEEYAKLDRIGVAVSLPGSVPRDGAVYAGAPEIADAIVDGLIDREFDVAVSYELPKPHGKAHGIPHAFGFVYRRIMNDAPPPTVPIFANVGEARNQPRLRRMLKFGHALKAAIDALPDNLHIALIASGGFTHFTIDEEFDREVIAAMQAGDEEKLASFPESYFWGNTCETKSWYPLVAAMNDDNKTMDVIDYIPCYRSEAGTGQAMIFASWT